VDLEVGKKGKLNHKSLFEVVNAGLMAKKEASLNK
jgi:hypothetical protein